MLRFFQSKTLSNGLEAIVTSGTCEIGSYIVIYVNFVNATEILNTRIIVFQILMYWCPTVHLRLTGIPLRNRWINPCVFHTCSTIK